MSSILDALRKVEADERRRPIRLPPPEPKPRGRLAALIAAAAFVAGAAVVGLIVILRPGSAPEVQPAPSAPVVAAAPVPPPAPTAAPPTPSGPTAAPDAPTPAPAPASPPAQAAPPAAAAPVEEPVAETDSDVPEQITILRPAPATAPAPAAAPAPDGGAQAEVQVEALPTPTPEPPIDVLPGPPAGAPEIHVSFLIYSAVPARRTVSLTIDNGPLVTLREGQKSGSISLVRILRDRIHVEHDGRTYSVRAVL